MAERDRQRSMTSDVTVGSSPIHLLADPQPEAEAAVPVTVAPRPLTQEERLRVGALKLPFQQARSVVKRLVPEGWQWMVVQHIDIAEKLAVEGLEAAMREGR